MYIFVKPYFIFWYSHTKLYFLRYCFVSSSIVTNPGKVVIQPHLYSLSVVRTIVAGRKKGFRQTTLYRAIYQNPFVLSRFWRLYYFSFDSRTTVSTCPLHGNMSTACTFTGLYPFPARYFKSLARVALSQLT